MPRSISVPQIMGILNVTPDSFSDGGAYIQSDVAVTHGLNMVKQGASIIDIGAESTRPGADPVSSDAQIQRMVDVLPRLAAASSVKLSIDTTSAAVAAWAFQNGATIINDISGLRFEPEIADIVAAYDGTLVITHSRATPLTMQVAPFYDDVVAEVMSELTVQIGIAKRAGVNHIVVDPGIGFSKRLEDNLTLLREMHQLGSLGYPILIGTSRKSMISQVAGSGPCRLGGSLASALWAMQKGAAILRVHDVAQTQQAVSVWAAIS